MARSPRLKSGDGEMLRRALSCEDEPEMSLISRCLTELVRYYRHSAVGRRCTGVIHNMNTPLQVISFQLDLLEQKAQEEAALLAGLTPAPPELQALYAYRSQKLQQLQTEVEHLRDMVLRLALQSVHEGQEGQCYLDLNQVFRDELELYLADLFFKHRVEKDFNFVSGLPPLYGHYIDFSQTLRNLVDNALEAMADSPRRLLTVTTLVEKNARVLRIGDTGTGIPPEAKSRLFEPFFTTKNTREAPRAGLGLFLTRRLLEPYQGEITIKSRPGQTWVTVYLPLSG